MIRRLRWLLQHDILLSFCVVKSKSKIQNQFCVWYCTIFYRMANRMTGSAKGNLVWSLTDILLFIFHPSVMRVTWVKAICTVTEAAEKSSRWQWLKKADSWLVDSVTQTGDWSTLAGSPEWGSMILKYPKPRRTLGTSLMMCPVFKVLRVRW